MESDDGNTVIVFNGEVYNFKELARQLALEGLRSHSDTEVVLCSFSKLGVESLTLFNGIFAFAIYDKQKQKVWLVRDRLGVKPLYYGFQDGCLSFGSEIKALLASRIQAPQCDMSAIHEWIFYGATLGESTLYAGIHKLLPGHYLELDLKTFRSKCFCYWSPPQYDEIQTHGSTKEHIHKTRELLEQAVKRQLVADVPVGVFLSGGIDSTAITAFASRHYSGTIATYSAGFDFDKGVNELAKARAVAKLFATDHHEIYIQGTMIGEIAEKMVEHHGMPFSDAANIPLYLLASKINGATKVVLQGDGGDEMFGGYRRYSTLSFYRGARVLAKFGSFINQFTPRDSRYYRRQRYLTALGTHDPAETMALLLTEEDPQRKPASIFSADIRRQFVSQDPFARYRACQRLFKGKDILSQMLLVDAMIILPDIFLEKVDRATMAAGIEARVPFLDNDVVDFCMRLSGPQRVSLGRKKWLLKKALKGIVPDFVLFGEKVGFGVPYGYWLRSALRTLFFDQMQAFQMRHPGVLDSTVITVLYDEHTSQKRDHSFLLWKILNFMVWVNRFRIRLTYDGAQTARLCN